MALEVGRERFEELVGHALDGIPDELAAAVRNVVVQVVDEPPDGEPRDLLGLYVGVALPDRDGTWGAALPDQILICRRPLLEYVATEAQLVEEVRITVVHEVAHHFGIDDARLHELGYGLTSQLRPGEGHPQVVPRMGQTPAGVC